MQPFIHYLFYSILRDSVRLQTDRHTHTPVWVFECIGSREVSSQVVSQQHHLLQPHPLPPLLQGRQELLLRPLWVCAEPGPAAPAKTQQVQGVDRPGAGQGVQVLGPQSHPTPKAMEEHQRRPGPGLGLGERGGAGLMISCES